MGRDKAFIVVDDRPLAARALDALRAAGAAEVLAIGGDLRRLATIGFDRVVPDVHPGEGPLGGLLTALGTSAHEVVVVLACDLPAVTGAAIGSLLAGLDAHDAAVAGGERPQPLVGAWHRSRCLPGLREAFDGGERAVHRALGGLDVHLVDTIPAAELHNANRPGDLPR